MGYNLLAEDLLYPFHTNMDLIKILEILMLICFLFLLEFQWNNLYFA